MKKELEKLVNSKRSVIISGNTLTGKTCGVCFPIVDSIINNKESLFIIDSKKEYLNRYYKELKDKNYNVIVINFVDPYSGDGWNPYTHIKDLYYYDKKDLALMQLDNLHSRIFYSESCNDPFWEVSASDVASAAALSIMKYGEDEELNINSVSEIVTNCSTNYSASTLGIEYFKDINDPDVCSYSKVIVNAPKETRGGILSVASQKLRLYSSRENISRLLSKSTFKYSDLCEKTAIFVEIPKQESYLSTLAVMFLEQVINYLDYTDDTVKMNFILDNYDVLNHSKSLYSLLTFNEYDKCKLYIVTRSIKRIKEEYREYYETLATIVKVKDGEIEFNYSDEDVIKVKKDKFKNIKYNEVELDKKINEDVIIFDCKEKLKKFNEPVDINELIERIDKKIEELEKED